MLLSPRSYLTRSQNSIRVCHIFCEPPPPGVYQRLKQAAISLYNYFFSPTLPLSSVRPLTLPDTPPPAPTYAKPFPRLSLPVRSAVERRESAVQTNLQDVPREKRRREQGRNPLPAKKRKVQFRPAEVENQQLESLFNPQEMERLKTGSCSSERFLARLKRVGRTRSASPHESDLSCPTTPEPEGRYLADPISPEPVVLPAAPLTAPHSLAIQPTVVAPLQPVTIEKEAKVENLISSPPLFDLLSSATTSVPLTSPTLPSMPTSPMKLASESRSPSPPPPPKPLLEITPSPQPSIPPFSTAPLPSDSKPVPTSPPPEDKKEEAKIPAVSTTTFSNNPFLSPLPTAATSYKFVFGAQSSPEKPTASFTPQVSAFSLPQDTEMAAEQHGAPSPFFPMPFTATPAPIPVPDFGVSSQLSPIPTFGGPAVFGTAGNGQTGGFSLGVVKRRQR